MGGKTSTSSQTVSVPPEVLARYNAVNARAEDAASQKFKQYSSDPNAFVAPLTQAQQQGISQSMAASGQAQPYYGQATNQLLGAQQAASGYYGSAAENIAGGQDVGSLMAQKSLASLGQASQAASPLQQNAANVYQQAYMGAQPFQNQAAGAYQQAYAGAQPYQDTATSLGLSGARQISPGALTGQQINQYMSPYLSNVVGAQAALLNQQNQQQQAGQMGQAIRQGAFGGDRAGIAAANLAQQQNLANSQIYSNLLNQGYGQALATAQQQQGLQLSSEQANRAAQAQAAQQMAALGQQRYAQGMGTGQAQAALGQQIYGQGMGLGQAQAALGQQLYGQGAQTSQLQAALGQQQYGQALGAAQAYQGLGQGLFGMGSATSQGLANLGTGAQAANLQGAQAQMAAGQAQQQTEQAGKTALYNQFLQQQSYPFQVAQFLANIAEGTGALSGSTTTTQQPGGFFSDERLKENIHPIGKTHDGQNIYRYNYKGEPETRIGLLAQEVEHKHPDAVGLAGGYKTVDYDKATRNSSMGGGVHPEHFGEGFADGGMPYPDQQQKLDIPNEPNTRELPKPDKLDKPKTGFEQAMDVAKVVAQIAAVAAANGGRIEGSRSHYADGGTPYSGSQGMDIPNQQNTQQLKTAGPLQNNPTGFQNLLGVAGLAGNIAGVGNLFKNSGGSVEGLERGHFAYGGAGMPIMPGLGAADYGSMLEAQAQMFGPFGQAGMYGGSPAGAPHGGVAGYVPQASLPVSHLATAGALPTQVSPMEQAAQIAELGKDAAEAYAGYKTWSAQREAKKAEEAKKKSEEAAKKTTTKTESHGGLVADRHGYALDGTVDWDDPVQRAAAQRARDAVSRGLGAVEPAATSTQQPYDRINWDDPKLASQRAAAQRARDLAQSGLKPAQPQVATEVSAAEQQKMIDYARRRALQRAEATAAQEAANASRAGLGAAESTATTGTVGAGTAGAGAGEAAAAGSRGLVRAAAPALGRAAGVAGLMLQPSETASTSQEALNALRLVEANGGKDAFGRPVPQSKINQWKIEAGIIPAPQAAPAATQPRKPAGVSAARPPAASAAAPDAAAPAGGVAPPQQTPATPAAPTPEQIDAASDEVGTRTGLVGGETKEVPSKALFESTKKVEPTKKQSIFERARSAAGDLKAEQVIPFLTGLAAMGTAPTRSLGVALASGVGAGARSYLPVKSAMADIQGAQIENAEMLSKLGIPPTGDTIQLADGSMMLRRVYMQRLFQGTAPETMQQRMQREVKGTPAPKVDTTSAAGQPPAAGGQMATIVRPEGSLFSDATIKQANDDYNSMIMLTEPEIADVQERNATAASAISEAAAGARAQGQLLTQLAREISSIPENSPLSGGYFQNFKSTAINALNDIARTAGNAFGVAPDKIPQLGSTEDLQADAVKKKLNAVLGFARSHGANQNSLGALEAALAAVPGQQLTRDQAMAVISSLMVDKQHAIDEERYVRDYRNLVGATSNPNLYRIESARGQYRRDYSEDNYAKSQTVLNDILNSKSPGMPELRNKILSGQLTDEEKKKLDVLIEKHYGIKDAGRFIWNY